MGPVSGGCHRRPGDARKELRHFPPVLVQIKLRYAVQGDFVDRVGQRLGSPLSHHQHKGLRPPAPRERVRHQRRCTVLVCSALLGVGLQEARDRRGARVAADEGRRDRAEASLEAPRQPWHQILLWDCGVSVVSVSPSTPVGCVVHAARGHRGPVGGYAIDGGLVQHRSRFYRPPASGEATARERGWGDGQAAVGRRSCKIWMNVSVRFIHLIELGSVGARLSAVPLFSSASAPVRHFSIWRITRSLLAGGFVSVGFPSLRAGPGGSLAGRRHGHIRCW